MSEEDGRPGWSAGLGTREIDRVMASYTAYVIETRGLQGGTTELCVRDCGSCDSVAGTYPAELPQRAVLCPGCVKRTGALERIRHHLAKRPGAVTGPGQSFRDAIERARAKTEADCAVNEEGKRSA